ncbi:MAG TPA: hypothetical protein VHC70_09545 [Phycisphaerales bacterium]|nr:hypothetical protein [Phycisphaerales bacterium]
MLWVIALALGIVGVALATQPIQTTRSNFFNGGTRPLGYSDALIDPNVCSACHGYYNEQNAPYERWNHSMMGQSARDPVFYAALAVTEQDASYVAESCMRCHAPMTWLRNLVKFDNDTASPTYGKMLPLADANKLGVACHICHRMVDPVYQPGVSPSEDLSILTTLGADAPTSVHNANFVIDPLDRRRGPFDLDADWATITPPGFQYHAYLQSPFHLSSRMCATCHDVSTSHFTKQPDGTYALNAPGQAPAASKYDQFPEQRTFSEWSESQFAQGPVDLANRFGGTSMSYSTCQSCHMPIVTGEGCALEPPTRPDLPQHNFNGANTWVLKAVRALYNDSDTDLSQQYADDAIARSTAMLQNASDLQVSQQHASINVRIINFTGHKLPTGYNEGRRMWINVKYKDAGGNVIAERGAYDPMTAVLTTTDTKVYEATIGPDATMAALAMTTASAQSRLAISNHLYKDNRIPPMGFTNAGFQSVQAGSMPANLYADGQYWDDTAFTIPPGSRTAEVNVYYQTSSKEYMEFLRDANTSNSLGQTAYDQWVAQGKSEPVLMDSATLQISCRCDWNGNGVMEVQDIFDFLNSWFMGNGDLNGNGTTEIQDIFDFLNCWFAGCNGW